MTERIIDLAESAAYLRCERSQLVVERRGQDSDSVPMAEVAALVLAHPQVTATLGVLSALMEKGGSVVVCNSTCQPVGMMLPTAMNATQTRTFGAQAAAPLPMKKRLWKQIIRAKILAQAALLADLRHGDHGLAAFAAKVRAGDPSNVEGQAARKYWRALFDDPDFRRDREAADANRMLNYGYAVLRAVTGRAICASGLHPSLGLHHHNQYNPYCLADDLMEPFRPLVDRTVIEVVEHFGADAPLDRRTKQVLLEGILARYDVDGEVRTLFDALSRVTASLVRVYLGEAKKLNLPGEMIRAGNQGGAFGVSADVALRDVRPAGGDQEPEA